MVKSQSVPALYDGGCEGNGVSLSQISANGLRDVDENCKGTRAAGSFMFQEEEGRVGLEN